MKEDLKYAGHDQGNMAPKVEGYQKPMACYSQEGFSKTLNYIERNNNTLEKQAKNIEKQAYKGRYS